MPSIRWTGTIMTALNLLLRRLAALREGAGPGIMGLETLISVSSAKAKAIGLMSALAPDALEGAGAEALLPAPPGETGKGENAEELHPEETEITRIGIIRIREGREGIPQAGPRAGAITMTKRGLTNQTLQETDAKRALRKRTEAGAEVTRTKVDN